MEPNEREKKKKKKTPQKGTYRKGIQQYETTTKSAYK
jgi:hypothetical protein